MVKEMRMRDSKKILYVDDDPDDREFLADAIRKTNPSVEVVLAENGVQAMDYLKGAKSGEGPQPCLIVLDLNMPLMNGRETFNRIKEDSTLRDIPVVVFTSSEKPQERASFNSLGVEYITKPLNLSFMSSIAKKMIDICCPG
jgi:CheY-like chemotaxis protein